MSYKNFVLIFLALLATSQPIVAKLTFAEKTATIETISNLSALGAAGLITAYMFNTYESATPFQSDLVIISSTHSFLAYVGIQIILNFVCPQHASRKRCLAAEKKLDEIFHDEVLVEVIQFEDDLSSLINFAHLFYARCAYPLVSLSNKLEGLIFEFEKMQKALSSALHEEKSGQAGNKDNIEVYNEYLSIIKKALATIEKTYNLLAENPEFNLQFNNSPKPRQ